MKKLTTLSDLALMGASPAFDAPLHVGRPNIGNRDAFLSRVNDILDTKWLSNNGPMVKEFESKISKYLGVKHCIAMCNGTVSLEIAIRALGMKGEVIVPSYTFIATAHALQWQEITPVFADIDPATHNLDPDAVRRMITSRTTGIIGVHLWGRPCPIEELQGIANENGLDVMFDASHAFSNTYKGRKIGGFGRCEVFSFHATKFFNTFEGGAVVTNDDELAAKIRLMKNFGFSGYDNVIYPGTNGKMIEICAAMGLTGLDEIEHFKATNKKNYQHYRREIQKIPGLKLLEFSEEENCNYQYIVVEVLPSFPASRDTVVDIFHKENILVRKYFWPGCHNMLPYRLDNPNAKHFLANTVKVSEQVVVLPTGLAIGEKEIQTIVDIFRLISNEWTADAEASLENAGK